MGKRTNSHVIVKSGKKAKLDAKLASVADVIKHADHLPEQCRAMLVDMLPFSLSVPLDERHEHQTWAVDIVEQTLNTKKAALEAAVATEDEKLVALRSSEGDLANSVKEAEAKLDAQKEVVQQASHSLAAAKEAANTAGNTLLALQEQQTAIEAKLASIQEERSALEPAFEAHYKVKMEEGAGPDFKELQPFLKKIEMETSFLKALPSSCSKSKADRGSFDDVVLQELEKALSLQIASLGAAIADDTAGIADRVVAIEAAGKDHEEKKGAEKQATDASEAAETEQNDRQALLSKAQSAVEDFQPQVEAITGLVDKAKKALGKFEAGPFTHFTVYKTRVGVEPEAATAGA